MTIEPIQPHGFCRGVAAAVKTAAALLSAAKGPVYCLHALVHNEQVVAELAAKGLVVVEEVAAVPEGAPLLLSAHGVPPAVRAEAAARQLRVTDATCPFVARVQAAARAFARRGVPIVVIGRAEHVEVVGVVGEAVAAGGNVRVVRTAAEVARLPFSAASAVGVVAQTTLSAEERREVLTALAARYPRLELQPASDVCPATGARQEAVRAFVKGGGDGVLVVGGAASSNTRRLVEVAKQAGARFAARVSGPAELAALDFGRVARLGVTAGASTPESIFTATIQGILSLPDGDNYAIIRIKQNPTREVKNEKGK